MGLLRTSLVFATVLGCASLLGVRALASGPVERLVQVLVHPDDPNVLVVRWSFASEGYLYSRDGGKTFAALCSEAIAPEQAKAGDPLTRLSGQHVPSLAANLLDARGQLLLGQLDGLWRDDATGCSWSKHPGFEGLWPYALMRDPSAPGELLALVNKSDYSDAKNPVAEARLMRAKADGTWTRWEDARPLRAFRPKQRVYGSGLVGAGKRLYALIAVSEGPLSAATARSALYVVASVDGGKTWSPGHRVSDAYYTGFALLGVDPQDEARVLGVMYRDGASDTMLISDDAGATFREYMGPSTDVTVRETAGLSFTPDGRLFVADAGDNNGEGGLYTAARAGAPLARVANTPSLDCLQWSPANQTLYACNRDGVGTVDPVAGGFRALARMQDVPALLSCEGIDVAATCERQLNMGPSWCCAGHYPFTSFCSQYDVTRTSGRRVLCGRAGQEYERNAGRVAEAADAGAAPTTMPVKDELAGEERVSKEWLAIIALGALVVGFVLRAIARARARHGG